MRKTITQNVRDAVQKATESILEETKEVDMLKIAELLESEYRIRFFNYEELGKLVQEALKNIVYIYI